MKRGFGDLTPPAVGRDGLRLHYAVAIDNEWLLKYTPEVIITVARVNKFVLLVAASNDTNLETVSKRWPSGFDHRHWYDPRAVDVRYWRVPCSRSPTRIRTRSHLKNQFTTGHQIFVQQKRPVVRLAVQGR